VDVQRGAKGRRKKNMHEERTGKEGMKRRAWIRCVKDGKGE